MNLVISGLVKWRKNLGLTGIRFGLDKKNRSRLPKAERFRRGFGKLAAGEKKTANEPHLEEVLAQIVEHQIAGSPMLEKVRWTSLKDSQIVRLFGEKGHSISRFIAQQLTGLAGLAKRRMKKTKTFQEALGRDGQFGRIADLKREYQAGGLPILSVDTKSCRWRFWDSFIEMGSHIARKQ